MLIIGFSGSAQTTMIKGEVFGRINQKPLKGVKLSFESSDFITHTDGDGKFTIEYSGSSTDILILEQIPYAIQRIPIEIIELQIDLGRIFLELDQETLQDNSQLVLAEESLSSLSDNEPNLGPLAATRDLLIKRAAFDFGQVFFRIRGYDSRNGLVLINGIPMNRMLRGRPRWSNWGGLNDVTRNQQHILGLQANPWNFGDVLGVLNIDTRPGGLRPGLRFSSSLSNRTYSTRIMTTYTSQPPEDKGFCFSVSASYRWAESAFFEGTAYKSHSLFGALEYQFDNENGIYFTGIYASNTRGSKAAITQELIDLGGRRYNPFWGYQNAKIRNSRIKQVEEPICMINFYHRSRKLDIEAGASYQWGIQANSRLGYYNAPNPNPDYYRNLPSYYINSPIGADFLGARITTETFKADPQLNWAKLYQINQSFSNDGKASYILYEDSSEGNSWRGHFQLNWKLGASSFLDLGFNISNFKRTYYARINDLLGAEYHEDIDAFSNTMNQLDKDPVREEGDLFGYHYQVKSGHMDGFVQWRFGSSRWNGFIAGQYYVTTYTREGLFRNERYPENSLGSSRPVDCNGYGLKSGISYELTKRHRFESNAYYSYRPKVLVNVFVNPRENNNIIDKNSNELVYSADLGYRLELPSLSGRITGYYTRFRRTTDINFFFVDSGVGSDFVQQVLPNVDKLHAGIECGVSFMPSSSITISAAASVSKFIYANNPEVSINFDISGPEEELINVEGEEDLGIANIKNMNLARGPAQAFSFGVDYRDPKFWWTGITLNRLANNYISLSPITRTESFKLDPESGDYFPNATEENIKKVLNQKPLPEVYLLNLTFGKSWIWDKKYISLFLSISNLLDTEFMAGGFEQSRNGNYGQVYQDQLSGQPSFGPKYWAGYGRTYFLNFSINF
ncbi:MAG: TonB-dependent receptor [Flavobacteriaceae bacterium]